MDHSKFVSKQRTRRRFRVRKRLKGTAERPRLSVKRTHKHLYCQLIDDDAGKTLLAASTLDKDLRGEIKNGGNKDAAVAVGKAVAAKAQAIGIKAICLDRGQYKYHGRVAQLADAVREVGINL
jgi:large subunit ribosomal protein L18